MRFIIDLTTGHVFGDTQWIDISAIVRSGAPIEVIAAQAFDARNGDVPRMFHWHPFGRRISSKAGSRRYVVYSGSPHVPVTTDPTDPKHLKKIDMQCRILGWLSVVEPAT